MRVLLIDAVTGDVVANERAARPGDEHDRREERGWILRYRTRYARRTGHTLRVKYTSEPGGGA